MLLTDWLKSAAPSRHPFPRRYQKRPPSIAEVEVLEDRCLLATFVVNTLLDDTFGGGNLATESNDGSGLSLREAVGLANASDGVRDDILFSQALLNTSRVITLTNGQIQITDDVTIRGPSPDPGGILVSGNNSTRVFSITSAANNVSFQFFTITQGSTGGDGAGLFNQGPNTILTDMVISANQATFGGGISNNGGMLQIFRSRIISNSATSNGGGLDNVNSGTLIVRDSTITANMADSGGGIIAESSSTQTSIFNSTIYNNTASSGPGGGIANQSTTSTALTIQNSTIVGNLSTGGGGGVSSSGGTVNVTNLTIANNFDTSSNATSGAGGISRTGGGTITGLNLVVSQNNSNSGNSNTNAGALNGSGSQANMIGGFPQLGPLQDNGGPTLTMLPLPGSPVLGAGVDPGSSILYDQRGFPRRASATGSGALGGASASTDQGAVELFPTITQPYIVGPGNNNGTLGNKTFDAAGNKVAATSPRFDNSPYGGFPGEVRVALADINGDGTKDIITAPGQGGGANIIVRNGVDPSQTLRNFFAYNPFFRGGVFVAAGDINGDNIPDIITGTGPGSSNVRVFDGADTTLNQGGNFFPTPIVDLNPFGGFQGGVRVASGDIDNDGRADLIVAAGPGGGPHVKIYSGAAVVAQQNDNALIGGNLRSFFPYSAAFSGGVFVASGDINGDGITDLITGAGESGGPHVQVFTNNPNPNVPHTPISSFFAYGALFSGGVRVGAVDFDGDKFDDIITGAGPGGGPHVRVISGRLLTIFGTPNDLATLFPYDLSFTGGVFVAGSKVSLTGGSPLQLAEGVAPSEETVAPITNADLTAITQAAIDRFEAAGASQAALARLESTTIQVADLGGDLLGLTLAGSILIDADAAGVGFFIDATPGDDLEFQTASGYALSPEARGRVDLLSVVVHEFAHVLGLPDVDSAENPDHFLADRIAPGVRRFVREEDLDALDLAFQSGTLDEILDID